MITTYHKGDKVEFIGKSETFNGGLFHEFILLDGYREGETVWLADSHIKDYTPKVHAAIQSQNRLDEIGIFDYNAGEFYK